MDMNHSFLATQHWISLQGLKSTCLFSMAEAESISDSQAPILGSGLPGPPVAGHRHFRCSPICCILEMGQVVVAAALSDFQRQPWQKQQQGLVPQSQGCQWYKQVSGVHSALPGTAQSVSCKWILQLLKIT